VRVRRMASPLTAEKNVRQKLKKINEIIDRADELYHQNIRSEGARNLNTHDDDDDNNNKSRDADTANNNLTKLLSQRMKMKTGRQARQFLSWPRALWRVWTRML